MFPPKDFPSLPPNREIEFGIDLVPVATNFTTIKLTKNKVKSNNNYKLNKF